MIMLMETMTHGAFAAGFEGGASDEEISAGIEDTEAPSENTEVRDDPEITDDTADRVEVSDEKESSETGSTVSGDRSRAKEEDPEGEPVECTFTMTVKNSSGQALLPPNTTKKSL